MSDHGEPSYSKGREWLKFLRIDDYIVEFGDESDRGCAILAACVLEDFLWASLHWRLGQMADSFIKELAPRRRLNVTISSCGLVGIMSRDEMEDARRLVRIRNSFAHKLTKRLTFEDEVIVNELRQIKLLNRVISKESHLTGKRWYLFSMATLQLHVAQRFVLLDQMCYAEE